MLLNHVATGSLLKNKVRAVWTISGSVVTALILALPHLLSAQGSPLAVQPSTANVGIGLFDGLCLS